ncbi:MAG: hypothetical protein QM817_01530 [Archangium sp.]
MAREPVFRDDFVGTYFAVRVWLALLAFVLPISICVTGHSQGLDLQPSMSAYFYSDGRNFFVGFLCAVACGLVAYKGFSKLEDYSLNAAGAFALGVAFFPMGREKALTCNEWATSDWPGTPSFVHGVCALGFFVCLAVVVLKCAHRTLHFIPSPTTRLRYRAIYTFLGCLFVVAIVVVGVFLSLTAKDDCHNYWLLGVEWAGVWTFGIFWIVKTVECRRYRVDSRAPSARRSTRFNADLVSFGTLMKRAALVRERVARRKTRR